jgi:hypothetical protein
MYFDILVRKVNEHPLPPKYQIFLTTYPRQMVEVVRILSWSLHQNKEVYIIELV